MRTLPWATGPAIVGGRGAMILAPHADDEVIGCGGLIQTLVQANIAVELVFVTDGAGSHPRSLRYPAEARRLLREREALVAAALLGLSDERLTFLRMPDMAAPHTGVAFAAAVQRIAALASTRETGTVLAPWQHDPHCDHLAAHLMAAAVAALIGIRHPGYPVWGWTSPAGMPLDLVPLPGHRLALDERQQATRHRALQAQASKRGHVIIDDPGGFILDSATLDVMLHSFEVFLTTP